MEINNFKDMYDVANIGLNLMNKLYFKRDEMVEMLPQSKDFAKVYGSIEGARQMFIKIIQFMDKSRDASGEEFDFTVNTIDETDFYTLRNTTTETFLLLGKMYEDALKETEGVNIDGRNNTILANTVSALETLDKVARENHCVDDDILMRDAGNFPFWDNKEIMRIAHGEHNNR